MVITNILGGLGNQMFQYAVGRALSIKYGNNLLLDVSGFENYGLHHGNELQRIFNCKTEIASKVDVRRVLGWQSLSFVQRLVLRSSMKKFRCTQFVVEPHFHYWSGIKNLTGCCYLHGYWQSENYFVDVATQIREDFTFKLPMQLNNAKLAVHINNVNAVSVHVRRGDYVNNTATYALCSSDYYKAAIKYISERVEQPYLYIFSDDISWVKNNLKIDLPHQYVDHNYGEESYNDMRLMSLCKHHIIANSSFSWWGAWLNSSTDKIVVAPQRWFAIDTDVSDLLPLNWVSV